MFGFPKFVFKNIKFPQGNYQMTAPRSETLCCLNSVTFKMHSPILVFLHRSPSPLFGPSLPIADNILPISMADKNFNIRYIQLLQFRIFLVSDVSKPLLQHSPAPVSSACDPEIIIVRFSHNLRISRFEY